MVDQSTWISARQAALRIGVSESVIPKVAEANRIRIRDIPGMKVRYHSADIDSLVASMVKLDGRRETRAVG